VSGQSHKASLLETCLSTLIGFAVAVTTQMSLFPLMGIHVSEGTNFTLGAAFTVVSGIRGYCVRRLFNSLHVRGIL
jgi:hypothetical protein